MRSGGERGYIALMLTRCSFLIIALLIIFIGCTGSDLNQREGAPLYNSFRDIPGVTEDEIRAIEALQTQNCNFVFGATLSTESFIRENGEIGGFIAMFCD